MPVKTKGRAIFGEDRGRLKAWQPNPAHMIAPCEPFLYHLNLLSRPVMQRPMCSPVTDLPQNRQTERERYSTETGTPTRNPVTDWRPTWGKVVSREHEADRLARIAEPGDGAEEDFQ